MTTMLLTLDEETGLSKVLAKVIKRRRNRMTLHPNWVVDEVMRVIDPYGEIERINPERAALYRARTRSLLPSTPPPTTLEAWLEPDGSMSADYLAPSPTSTATPFPRG
jgi:hypothetical protein